MQYQGAVVALALAFSSCANDIHPKDRIQAARGSVLASPSLAWIDVARAEVFCGEELLKSAWQQLFPSAQGVAPELSRADIHGRLQGRNSSLAALDLELSSGDRAISMIDEVSAPGAAPNTVLRIFKADQVRNLTFTSTSLPKFIALFSGSDVRRRADISTPSDLDGVLQLRMVEAAQEKLTLPILPALEGAPTSVTLETGDHGACLKKQLRIQ